jgi:hemerythrin superfamily protein
MLQEDHAKVKALFSRFEEARTGAQKERLASEICHALKVHAELEEQVFYPPVRDAIGDDDLMDEAEVEHRSAKDLIAQIESSSADGDKFDAMVTVLGEYVRHHIQEEEGEIFRKVRASELDLVSLAQQMRARKSELKEDSASRSRVGASTNGSRASKSAGLIGTLLGR